MASQFQRDKLVDMFRAFDADDNGYLDQRDFQALAERWRRLPRVTPGSELSVRVESLMLGWWDHLAAHVDTDGDGKVDLDELLAMVDLLPTMREVVAATAETVFDAVDENGDGRISPPSTSGWSTRGTASASTSPTSSPTSTRTGTATSAAPSSPSCGSSSGSATTRPNRATGCADP